MMYLLLLISLIHAKHHASNAWSFLHMADWGGTDAPQYTKSAQCVAGNAMDDIAQKYNIDTILAVGDNFYHYGVTADNAKGYFEHTFNNVYKGKQLDKAKFYAVAGNHDHRGDVQAQINYPLEKWVFPNHWYTFTKDMGNGMTAQFIMIDTVELVGESYHDKKNNIFVSATGPKNLQRAQSQWSFIENELASSTADFLFVAGHYPVYSPCSHGSTTDLVRYLKPLLEQYDVTAYIAGHDHCASYVDEGLGPVYPMNGMGDECCYKPKKLTKMQKLLNPGDLKFYVARDNTADYGKPQAGFNSYTLHSDGTMEIRFHDQKGHVIYSTTSKSRRVQSRLMATEQEEEVSNLEVYQLVLMAAAACIFGCLLTLTWFRCTRKENAEDYKADLMMDTENQA